MVVKVGVAKLGNIASGVMAELLLDERADREDMQTFMATSGTKLQPGCLQGNAISGEYGIQQKMN